MKIYNVCDDYSLSLSELTELPKGYKWHKGKFRDVDIDCEYIRVELGYCKKHNELHYLITESEFDLENRYIQ